MAVTYGDSTLLMLSSQNMPASFTPELMNVDRGVAAVWVRPEVV